MKYIIQETQTHQTLRITTETTAVQTRVRALADILKSRGGFSLVLGVEGRQRFRHEFVHLQIFLKVRILWLYRINILGRWMFAKFCD